MQQLRTTSLDEVSATGSLANIAASVLAGVKPSQPNFQPDDLSATFRLVTDMAAPERAA